MRGALAEGVLPGVLRDLYVGRRTGVLHLRCGEEHRRVIFRHGHIVHAETNVEGEHLSGTLVRRGILERGQVDRAVQRSLQERRRLGVVLAEGGQLEPDRLREALAAQAHELLLKVFSLWSGTYVFEDREDPGTEETTLAVSTGEIVLQAARQVRDPELIRYALGDTRTVLAPSTDPLLRFQSVTLNPVDGYVMSRVDGTSSMEDVIRLSPVEREEAERSLFSLLCVGLVERLPGPAPRVEPAVPVPPRRSSPARESSDARRREILEAFEGLRARTHFEVLGIAPGAGDAEVKEAYFGLAKRFHPDAHHDPSLSDLREKLEAVFIRLGTAYEVLRSPRSRTAYEAGTVGRMPKAPPPPEPAPAAAAPPPPADPEDEARNAAAALREAARRFDEGHYWDVIQLLEPALASLKGAQKQQAGILLARAVAKNPNWLKRAEELLHQVAQDDPRHVEVQLELGRLYQGRGMRARAASAFRRALELDPQRQEAAAALEALERAEAESPTTGRASLLRRLLGKERS